MAVENGTEAPHARPRMSNSQLTKKDVHVYISHVGLTDTKQKVSLEEGCNMASDSVAAKLLNQPSKTQAPLKDVPQRTHYRHDGLQVTASFDKDIKQKLSTADGVFFVMAYSCPNQIYIAK